MHSSTWARTIQRSFALDHAAHYRLGHFEDLETRHCRRLAHYSGVCVTVICVCLIQNYLIVPDVFGYVMLFAVGLAIPLLIGSGLLASRRRRPAAEFAALASFSTLPLWAFSLIGSSRSDEHLLALYGLNLCCHMFVWYNATFGVRLWKPILCYAFVAITGIAMFLRLRGLSWQVESSLAMLVLTAAVFAILSNLFMHRDERGFVSEGQRLLTAIAAGRHDLWAFDITSGHIEMLRATPSGPRRTYRMTFDQYMAWVHPDDREYVREYVRDCIEGGESQTPCQYRLASNSREHLRWCEGIGKVVEHDLDGKPLTILGMTHNISDRKQLTRQLQQQAEEIACATSAKSEFLATMSHEIRTPLNGILGMASLLTDADLTIKQQEMVSIIRDSGTALLQILNDVLDFSKIEAGKLAFTEAPLEVRGVAADCVRSIEAVARQKSIFTGFSVAPEVSPWLCGDAVHLRTILTHLLSNAVKFTAAGRVDLEIFTCSQNQDGVKTLQFEVSDTGRGMDVDLQKKLFAPFTHAQGENLTANSSVGLGLALSKKLVEALGGSIACSSEVGRGSRFTVKLPFTVCEQPPPTQKIISRNPIRVPYARILVAEDNPVNQTVLIRMLKRLGYVPSVVANGQQALEALQDASFDIVFMDCEMPVLDGLEATRQIRRLQACQNMPIIALSAHSPGEHEALCVAAGMSGYLSKPVTLDDLQEQLSRWLSSSKNSCVPMELVSQSN